MTNFSYALEFDKQGILDITKEKDKKLMKKVIKVTSKIEEYFNDIFPNMDLVRPIIIFSFRLNNDYDMNYIDRINYIIGIIYSKKYIDVDDAIAFSNLMQHYVRPEKDGTFFYDKALYIHKDGFFADEFEEEEIDFSDMKQATMREVVGEEVTDEDEELFNGFPSEVFESNNKIGIDSRDFNKLVKTSFNSNPSTSSKEESDEDEENEEEIKTVDVEEKFDEDYIQITPAEKICLFKENFDEFVRIMLQRKGIPSRKNNRERVYVEKGMRDWFNYIISIISEIYEVSSLEYDRNIKDLSYFV